MILNRVVARFKDGSLIKGTTKDFYPNKANFHLEMTSGQVVDVDINQLKTVQVNIEDLKAAFFVKDLDGNKEYDESYGDRVVGAGKKIQVRFKDGEAVIGYALSYSPDRTGFFLIPADKKSNNERIFVVISSTEKIEPLQ